MDIGGGGGQWGGQGARMSHSMDRHVKAEFFVVIGEGGRGHEYHT